MVLTSRIKRPLNRTIPCLRDTSLIIIAAEGEFTEKQYFESSLFRNRRIQVMVLETENGHSAPIHVYKRLKEYAQVVNLEPDDQLWLMVDKDRWPDNQLAQVCSHAIRGRKKAMLAISNPSFELWLYLHIDDWTAGVITSQAMERDLRAKLGSYNKSNLDIQILKPGIENAVKRSKELDNNTSARWPSNPGTHVYKVIEEIWKLTENFEKNEKQRT